MFLFFLMIRRPPTSTRTTRAFPTRRSSDLLPAHVGIVDTGRPREPDARLAGAGVDAVVDRIRPVEHDPVVVRMPADPHADLRHRSGRCRSEEHTSELQSLMRISYAVFCLKTKKHNKNRITNNT